MIDDAARLDFMDSDAFVSLHQYISEGELYIRVERENPDGFYRGANVRDAIDAAIQITRV